MMNLNKTPFASLAALVLLSAVSQSENSSTRSTDTVAPASSPSAQDPKPDKPVTPPPADKGDKPDKEKADKEKTDKVTKAEVGKPAPDFTLKDIDGKEHNLAKYKGKIVVLEWFSPGCPACKYAYTDGPLNGLPERLTKDGVVWLPVNSEDPARPASTVKDNKAFIEKYKLKTTVLLDPAGTVGKSYGAKTTPHMYVIDAKGVLVYKGGLDNAPGGKVEGDGEKIDYVGNAVADIKAGRPVKVPEAKSYG